MGGIKTRTGRSEGSRIRGGWEGSPKEKKKADRKARKTHIRFAAAGPARSASSPFSFSCTTVGKEWTLDRPIVSAARRGQGVLLVTLRWPEGGTWRSGQYRPAIIGRKRMLTNWVPFCGLRRGVFFLLYLQRATRDVWRKWRMMTAVAWHMQWTWDADSQLLECSPVGEPITRASGGVTEESLQICLSWPWYCVIRQ